MADYSPLTSPDPAGTRLLVRRARAGDEDAYEALFERHAGRVLRFIGLRLGPGLATRVEPLDVLQETFLVAHASFASFDGTSGPTFGAWLCRIARHQVLRLAEYHGAEKRAASVLPDRITLVLDRVTAATRDGPVPAAERREAESKLESALASLEADLRDVVILRFFEERTIDEIAVETETSATTIRRRLGRAMRDIGQHVVDREIGDG